MIGERELVPFLLIEPFKISDHDIVTTKTGGVDIGQVVGDDVESVELCHHRSRHLIISVLHSHPMIFLIEASD
ncbi:hypothetical protein D1872_257940 [compost metagenome]